MNSATALQCTGLTKRFGDEFAVDDLCLSLDLSEVLAVVGFNGAGKTTLMRLILGMTRADSGKARVLGVPVGAAGPTQWRGVGHMIETPHAYPELTVAQSLWAAARLHGLTRAAAPEAVERVIERLDLKTYVDRRTSALSQGNKQRLGLASSLVHRPRLLILDEPTNALDPAAVVLLRELLRETASEGTAVLVSSHHLDEVARVADRVEVIHHGRLVGRLAPGGTDLEHSFFEMVHSADVETADERRRGEAA